MSAAVAATKPTKFVEEPPALLCPVCGRVLSEPVISVTCGHTFCRECVEAMIREGGRCPADGLECDSGQLVLNRAVMGQIADLKIYCSHGLLSANDGRTWANDPDGCREVRMSFYTCSPSEPSSTIVAVVCRW